MKPWRSILLVLAAGAALILAAVGTWASVQIPVSLMRQQGQWQQIEATHEALPLPAGARLTSRRVETPGVYSLICTSGRLKCPYDDRRYHAAGLSTGELRQMLAAVTGRSGGFCLKRVRTTECKDEVPAGMGTVEVHIISGRTYPGGPKPFLVVEVNAQTP